MCKPLSLFFKLSLAPVRQAHAWRRRVPPAPRCSNSAEGDIGWRGPEGNLTLPGTGVCVPEEELLEVGLK